MFLSPFNSRLLKRFSFLLLCYSFIRVGFYFYHLNIYRQFHQDEIFLSFIIGLRFDLAAICLVNTPIVLMSVLPFKNKVYQSLERALFVILNFIAIAISLVDYELFLFMGKRMSYDLFFLTSDIIDQLPQIILNYWFVPVAALGICFAIYLFDKTLFRIADRPLIKIVHYVTSFIFLGLTFIGIRGGLQHKSINVQSAFGQGKNELGHLVLNSPYHFIRTLKNKTITRVSYFKSDKEAIDIILKTRDFRDSRSVSETKNIVLIIMESFSLEYMEKGLMPFLLELQKDSVSFRYHLANGRRSIEALPSLLCGLPALIDEPISKSVFQGNKFVCMPQLLKAAGYTNVFFHGGARGTMGFDSYTLANGIDRYYSKSDYPDAKDFDGHWGIYDGPYFQFFNEKLKEIKEPFFAAFFSLSSHQPYSIPSEYYGKFPKGTLEIHESIGYSDYSLRKFFERAKTQDWYRNTIFLITADHTSKLESRKFSNQIGRYRVPFLIFSPGMKWGSLTTEKVTQHSDIPRTILDLAHVAGDNMPATSVSVLSGDSGYGLNYADEQDYLLISKDEVLRLNKTGAQARYTYNWDTGEMSSAVLNENPLLKAYLQYFLNGLLNNNLSLYR